MSGCRSCSGRLFHSVGPAVAKQPINANMVNTELFNDFYDQTRQGAINASMSHLAIHAFLIFDLYSPFVSSQSAFRHKMAKFALLVSGPNSTKCGKHRAISLILDFWQTTVMWNDSNAKKTHQNHGRLNHCKLKEGIAKFKTGTDSWNTLMRALSALGY